MSCFSKSYLITILSYLKNIKRVPLVYHVGNKVSTPKYVGRHIKLALEKHYHVTKYNYDGIKIIQPVNSDVFLGHWHPNPLTVFRMSAQKKGWKRVLALAPFCPDDMGKQSQPSITSSLFLKNN